MKCELIKKIGILFVNFNRNKLEAEKEGQLFSI